MRLAIKDIYDRTSLIFMELFIRLSVNSEEITNLGKYEK